MQKLRQGISNLLLLLPIFSPLINSLILSNCPTHRPFLSTAAQLHARWKALAKQKRTINSCAYNRTKQIPLDRMSKTGSNNAPRRADSGNRITFRVPERAELAHYTGKFRRAIKKSLCIAHVVQYG
jgi:hypothetical protein